MGEYNQVRDRRCCINSMIEINNLTKSYGNLTVLNNLSLKINQGEVFGLVGKSGAGKSTLLRCINGLEQFDEGEIVINNTSISNLSTLESRKLKKNIGMIFQNFSLLERMTVFDNIALPMKCWGYSKKEINTRVYELLELVDMSDKAKAKPRELSGGQKQRTAIARALALNPQILLCDEATSALDPNTAKSIMNLLLEINEELGITIIIVTHQIEVLQTCCEKIAILENGIVKENGNTEEVFLRQSDAWLNLIGEKKLPISEDSTIIKVLLSSQMSKQPVITQMAKELDIDFRIVGGDFSDYRSGVVGYILIETDCFNVKKVTSYLDEHQICWIEIKNIKGLVK